MAAKKKTKADFVEAEEDTLPGFFSDYGYGNGALILHNPPQKSRDAKTGKVPRNTGTSRKKRK